MELLHPSVVIFLQGFCSIDHVLRQVIMPFHSNSAFVRHSTVQCIPYSFFARGYFMVEAIFVPQAFWLIKCSTPKQTPIMSDSYIPRWVGAIWPNTSLLRNCELRCLLGESCTHVSKITHPFESQWHSIFILKPCRLWLWIKPLCTWLNARFLNQIVNTVNWHHMNLILFELIWIKVDQPLFVSLYCFKCFPDIVSQCIFVKSPTAR